MYTECSTDLISLHRYNQSAVDLFESEWKKDQDPVQNLKVTFLPSSLRSKLLPDASPQKIMNTLRLPSGVGATCVLKTPFNSTLDQLAQTLNPSANNSKTLAARYFDSMCLDSFTQGVPLSNFVPPPPSPAPSDDPDPRFEDRLWNFTVAPPTTVHGDYRNISA